MTATIVQSYLGEGLAAARPVIPLIAAGCIAYYYATDTKVFSVWNGAAWVSATGLTGSLTIPPNTSGAANNASFGNLITPAANISLNFASFYLTTVTGGVYKIGVAPYNTATNKITAPPTYGDTTTTVAAGAANSVIATKWSNPFAIAALQTHMVFIVRTDSTAGVSQTSNFTNTAAVGTALFVLTTGAIFSLASLAPTTADVWSGGTGLFGMNLLYAL